MVTFKILGYMLRFTDNDQTTEVPDKLPDGFLLSDADYNLAFADKPTPHSVDLVPPQRPPLTGTTIDLPPKVY
jgi:hypothetical protein